MPEWTYSGVSGDVGAVETNGTNIVFGTSDGEVTLVDSAGVEQWALQPDSDGINDIDYDGSEIFTQDYYDTQLLDDTGSLTSTYAPSDGTLHNDVYKINSTDAAVASNGAFSIIELDNYITRDSHTTTSDDFYGVSGSGVSAFSVASASGEVYVFDNTATTQNTHPIDSEGLSEIKYDSANDVYYVYSYYSGTVYKLDSDYSILWSNGNFDAEDLSDIAFDSVDGDVYVATASHIYQLDATGGAIETGYQGSFESVATYNGDMIYGGSGEIGRVSDSEFSDLVTASQPTVTGSPNSGSAIPLESISATPTTVSSSMNSDVVVEAAASQFTATTTVLTAVVDDLYEYVSATNVSASAVSTVVVAEDYNTEWAVLDSDGERHIASFIEDDGSIPQWKRGKEITRTFVFAEESHDATYSKLKGDYGRYLRDDTVTINRDYRGRPYYTQSISPNAPKGSYLFRVEPNATADLDDFWVIVTNIEDSTRVGEREGQSLELTMVPLAPKEGYDRNQVRQEFEATL